MKIIKTIVWLLVFLPSLSFGACWEANQDTIAHLQAMMSSKVMVVQLA
jgi:hypothetical protein